MAKIRLQLFVIGQSAISKRAIHNLKLICEQTELKDLCEIEIVDLCKHQDLAEKEKILATPLLIKKNPQPSRRIIGDLSNTQKVIASLEISRNNDA